MQNDYYYNYYYNLPNDLIGKIELMVKVSAANKIIHYCKRYLNYKHFVIKEVENLPTFQGLFNGYKMFFPNKYKTYLLFNCLYNLMNTSSFDNRGSRSYFLKADCKLKLFLVHSYFTKLALSINECEWNFYNPSDPKNYLDKNKKLCIEYALKFNYTNILEILEIYEYYWPTTLKQVRLRYDRRLEVPVLSPRTFSAGFLA